MLHRNSQISTNLESEIKYLKEFYNNAKGNILIAGAGLGVTLSLIYKYKRNEVINITVIEIAETIVDLISKFYKDLFKGHNDLKIINENIWQHSKIFKETKCRIYDYIWFDIWDEINDDSLKEMKKLKKYFSGVCDGNMGFYTRGN